MSRGRITAGRRPRVNTGEAHPDSRVERENHLPKRRSLFASIRGKPRGLATKDGAEALGLRGEPVISPSYEEANREPAFWERPTPLQAPRAAKPKE